MNKKTQSVNVNTGEVLVFLPRFKTINNVQDFPLHRETFDGRVSETKPDMTKSLREILFRHTNGQTQATDNGLVFTNGLALNLRAMDLVDKRALAEQQKERIQQLKNELLSKQKERDEAVKSKRMREYELWHEQKQKKSTEGDETNITKK